jgi:hypothetical protein
VRDVGGFRVGEVCLMVVGCECFRKLFDCVEFFF